MKQILLKILIATLPAFIYGAQQATDLGTPSKVDSYGVIACDDAMARLDAFALRIQNEPNAQGYIVVYPQKNGLAGKYQSYSDFPAEYLQMTRGISSDRLTTLRGEYREVLTTELWLASAKASLPITAAPKDGVSRGQRKFDEGFADYSTNQGKQELQTTYDLCPLGAVDFQAFAEQVRAEPASKGIIIIHLETGKSSSRARTMTRLLRDKMVKESGVNADRILIRNGPRRSVPSVELWIRTN